MRLARTFAQVTAALAPAYVIRGKLLGVPFTGLEVALVALVVLYVVEKALSGETLPDPRTFPYLWPVLLILVAATVAVVVAVDKRAAGGIWKAYFIEPTLGAYVIVDVCRTRGQAFRMLLGFFVGAAIVALLNEAAFLSALLAHRPNLLERPVVAVYNTPNATGLFLGPLLAAAAALLVFGDRFERMASAAFVVVAGPALALSFSRGAWLGLAGALIMLAFLHRRRILALGVVAAATGVAGLLPPVRARLAHEFNPTDPLNSVNSRIKLWSATLRMMQHGLRPLFGNGLSGFRAAIDPYRGTTGYQEDLIYPHNNLLTLWTETGLLGIAAFLWLVLAVARRVRRAIRAQSPMLAYHAALACAGTTMLVHGQLDVPFFKNDLAWLVMGLLGIQAAALRIDARSAEIEGQ